MAPFSSRNSYPPLILAGALLFFLSPLLQPISYNAEVAPWYTIPAALLIASAAYFHQKATPLKISRLAVAALLLAALPLLLQATTTPPQTLLFYAAFITSAAVAWLWGSNNRPDHLRLLYTSMLVGAFIWSVVALIVWLGFTDGKALRLGDWLISTHLQSKINGPFNNGNVFGMLVFCASTVALWFWANSRNSSGWHWLLLLIFCWSVAISSMSRGAWIAQAIVLLIALPLLLRISGKKVLLILAALAISVAIANQIHQHNAYSTEDFDFSERYSDTVEGGFGIRTLLWTSAFEIWNQNKIAGAGYGHFSSQYLQAQSAAFRKYSFEHNGLDYVTSAHNIPLHLMAEGGVAGGILAILTSLLVALALLKNWRRVNSVTWPATMIAFMLWLQGMANITMTRPLPILLFVLTLAIALSPVLRSPDSYQLNRKALALPLALVLLLLTVTGSHQVKMWWDYEEWLITDDNTDRKKELSLTLLSEPALMPFVVATTMQKVITDPARHNFAPKLLPFIHRAIELQGHRILYEGLFFAQVLDNKMAGACKTGMFMESQNWPNNNNSEFHHAACEGRLDSNFEIRPKGSSEGEHPTPQ